MTLCPERSPSFHPPGHEGGWFTVQGSSEVSLKLPVIDLFTSPSSLSLRSGILLQRVHSPVQTPSPGHEILCIHPPPPPSCPQNKSSSAAALKPRAGFCPTSGHAQILITVLRHPSASPAARAQTGVTLCAGPGRVRVFLLYQHPVRTALQSRQVHLFRLVFPSTPYARK